LRAGKRAAKKRGGKELRERDGEKRKREENVDRPPTIVSA